MKHQGQCLCGSVKLEAEISETGIHACHCSICRRWSGGSPLFALNADAVEIHGSDNISVYDSSEWADRGFCAKCGSNLYYRLKEPNQYIVCAGLFEDQSVFKLEGEIYVDECPGGYAFAGDHPRLTGEEFLASIQQG